MAVASAWTRGHSAPVPHIRYSPHSVSPYDCSVSNKFVDFRLRFISGWNCTVPKTPIPKYGDKNSKRHLYCRCSSNNNNTTTTTSSSSPYSSDWDWNRWTRHFSEIIQAETFSSILKFQLEDAIEKEDFLEAAKLKTAMAEATSKDCISEIMSELKNAIDEERYHDASWLCTSTGSGLVGWWVGCSKDYDDPFGRLISVTPGVGRFIGKSFSPRQLVTASPGTPLFEIFVVKDGNETYTMQVVFLKRAKGSMEISTCSSGSKSTKEPSGEIENAPVVNVELNEDKTEKGDEKSINFEGATEEGIRSVINFLKEKIPELKVKVMKVSVSEEVIEDIDSMKRLMEEDNENTVSSENSKDEAINLDDIQSDQVSLEGGSDALEDEKSLDMIKFSTDAVLHNKDEYTSKDAYMRVPGEIENMERDSFVLHVPMRIQGSDTNKRIMSNVKVAALAAQGASELMPPDVTKAFLAFDKISPKVFRNVRDIVKLADSQAQKKEKLSEYTSFNRIATSKGDLDPFDGLYVGAFGPYGTEVVQLRRKYGNWNDANETEESSKVEFFEYVEAVKLTGDLNIPAGQLTFRAKIGQGNRLSYTGMYPDELGVAASYTGQGRIAEFGFRNPKWVGGELLQLSGKGMGPYVKGADLGFLYVVPEQTFLVLFSRLKLPE